MDSNVFDTLFDTIDAIEKQGIEKDLVLLPHPNDPYASGEEVDNEDIGLAGNVALQNDVVGTFECIREIGKLMKKRRLQITR